MAALTRKQLQVRVYGDSDRATVEVHGEVDVDTAPRLGTILRALATQLNALIVVDLQPTTYLSLDGLRMIAHVHQSFPANPAIFEVQARAGTQPEQALRESGAHCLFSVVVWNSLDDYEVMEQPDMYQQILELRIPSDVFQVGRVRRLTEEVLRLAGVDESSVDDFLLAVGEAVANAVTHGSPTGGPGYVVFSLKPGPAVVTAEIQDFGNGINGWNGDAAMPPPDSLRGRGLGMMSVYADTLEVHTGHSGTLVRLHKQFCIS